MPHGVHPKAKPTTKPKRAAHRPSKFTRALGEKICELVACGWLMKDAARHFGISPETVCRWAIKHEAFREAYGVARAERAQFWLEQCIEIADR
jgi:terminase small subunit-like protein